MLKWSMIQLQKFRNKGLNIDETVNLESLKERDPEIRSVSPIQVRGRADIDSKKVTFHLNITGELILPSSRTLEDVHFPINIQSTETFLYEVPEYDDHDDDLHQIDGEMIDVTPIIEELILLEIPMQVFSEENEEVPNDLSSGKDWAFVQEEDLKKDKGLDPRLAELAKLLNQENK